MSAPRTQRRLMRRKAGETAARMARCCHDFHGSALVPVTAAPAIAALTRAFTLLLRAGGQSMAVPISEAEALGFPRPARDRPPGAVTWLAVGLDPEGRGTYALHSAASPDRASAHEVARSLALSRLALTAAAAGFPMGATKDRA